MGRAKFVLVCTLTAMIAAMAPATTAGMASGGTTARVSLDSAGAQGNDWSLAPSISADGRYVTFVSEATNLVTGDTNGQSDIFVRDLQEGTTTRVSVSSSEAQANGSSAEPEISADGRYVTFESEATNLVTGDTNGQSDIFVRDLQEGTTTRVSVSSAGTESDNMSMDACVSANGRYVAFRSFGSNLVATDTNGQSDIFVRDLQEGTTTRVSVSSSEAQANGSSAEPEISADGNIVVFGSWAGNLVADDTTANQEIFARDVGLGITVRLSRGSTGIEADGPSVAPSVSDNGRYVAYYSLATNLVDGDTNESWDFFVHDWMEGTTTRVTAASPVTHPEEGTSLGGSISADGRYVLFDSHATNLVSGDTNAAADVFVHDMVAGTTTRVSVDSAGVQGNASSSSPVMSADGRYVAYSSNATNLVSGDTNAAGDVFVYDCAGIPPAPAPPVLAPVYRFFNFTNNTHFFTDSLDEANSVILNYPTVFRYEGIAYYTNPSNNTQPLYRFYNRVSGSHFYTASLDEANTILLKWSNVYTLDGQTYAVSPGPVANSIPVYRFYNLRNGSHFYTASAEERDTVMAQWSNVYRYEGEAFWLGQ